MIYWPNKHLAHSMSPSRKAVSRISLAIFFKAVDLFLRVDTPMDLGLSNVGGLDLVLGNMRELAEAFIKSSGKLHAA